MRKFILLLAILLVLSMASCNTQQQKYYEKNPTPTIATTTQQPVYTYDADWTPMPQPTNSKGEPITGNPYDYINPERVYNIGEWTEINGFYFRVNGVEITKEVDGIDTNRLFDLDLEFVTTEDFSFFIIDIDVKNGREEAFEYCVGGIKPWMQQKDNGYNVADTRYIEPEMYHDKHARFYLFQPGEEVNFKIVSVIEDEYLIPEQPLYAFIKASTLINGADPNILTYDFDSYVVINKDKSEVDVYA